MMRPRATVAIVLTSGCGLAMVGTAPLDGGAGDAVGTMDAGTADFDAVDAIDPRDAQGAVDAPAVLHAGSALAFAASANQYVDFTSIPLPSDFTVEAWTKPASLGREMTIVSEDRLYYGADQFRLAMLATGELYFAMSDQNSNSFGLADYGKPVGP